MSFIVYLLLQRINWLTVSKISAIEIFGGNSLFSKIALNLSILLLLFSSLSSAPIIRLDNVENHKTAILNCTTTCGDVIAWRLLAQIDIGKGQWYEIIANSKTDEMCTEMIAITPYIMWPQSVNSVAISAVHCYLCMVNRGTKPSKRCMLE